jgi:hypothetical protein
MLLKGKILVNVLPIATFHFVDNEMLMRSSTPFLPPLFHYLGVCTDIYSCEI